MSGRVAGFVSVSQVFSGANNKNTVTACSGIPPQVVYIVSDRNTKQLGL